MIKRTTYILPLLLLAVAVSCIKIRHLPPEPYIEFREFTMFDTIDLLGNPSRAGRLKFYFEDGDGDLGVKVSDIFYGDTTNLFLTGYRKSNGVFNKITDPADVLKPANYRIPYIERQGQNQSMIGTVEVTIFYIFYESSDTLMYEFYIKDRAGHISNTENSCEISFEGEGGCISSPG